MKIRNMLLTQLVWLILSGCGAARPAVAPVSPTATTPEIIASATIANLTPLSGSYLGQKVPGPSPTRFASSFIKGELHTSPVFMPDGSEVYWSSQEPKIYMMKLENGYWTRPEKVAFSDSLTDYRDPFVSPSGDKLFFLSKNKLPGSELPEKENVWFVDRKGDGWGEPQPLGEEVNALTLHWQVSVAANGNLYFTSGETGFEDIYVSKYIDNQYVTAEPLGDPINTEQFETTPYIVQDESYIIFARLKDQSSYPSLYISYADQNYNWGEPVLIESISYGLCPVVSPDGKYLFFLSSPQSVSWINARFIEELKPPANTDALGRVSISPDTVNQAELVGILSGHTNKVLALAFSGDGDYIASDSSDGTIRLWDIQSGQSVHTFAKGESEMIITNSIAFSPNGNLLASAEAIWDVESGNIIYALNPGQLAPVAFSPDGSLLAIALYNQPPKLWGVTSGQVAETFVEQPQNADNLSINIAFSPDGDRVAAAGHLDGRVRLWDVHSGQIARSLSHGTESNIHDLAFSPDGELLASAGTDATVRIWDVASGQQTHSLGHRDGLWSVVFSPDGTLVASAGCDGTVQIWEVTSGKLLRTLDHNNLATSVNFSPDGTLLATGAYDNQVYLWGIPH